MADPRISAWLDALTRREIQPTLSPIPRVSYDAYRELIADRFANPEVGDTIPRLCLDGSNRQPKFILPTARQALAEGKPYDGLALEVALWCRYCAGTDEAGNMIPPNDENWEDLNARALGAKEDPSAFLSNALVFGDLGQDPPFAEAFGTKLRSLWTRGVESTLADYVRG
jgi:mannitol 2-dehydrogenase